MEYELGNGVKGWRRKSMDAVELWNTFSEEKMKLRRIIVLICVILIVVLAIGCTQPTTDTETPTRPPTLIVGNTTPSLIPTITALPVPTMTPTMLPTLAVNDARTELLDLLANNGNCRLPCLWGLSPGKSSAQEAQVLLSPLSSISGFTGFEPGIGSVSPEFTDNNFSLYTELNFLADSKNNIITHISFQVEAHKKTSEGYEKIFDSTLFGERVRFYELPSILFQHGVPDSIFIGTLAGYFRDGGSWGFHILLLYPDQGMLINYTTQMQIVGKTILGCPSNAQVEFELYPSGEGELFFARLGPTNWPQSIKSNYKPLAEVTSMSLDDFYQTFRQPTDKCIETPANLWPTPEP